MQTTRDRLRRIATVAGVALACGLSLVACGNDRGSAAAATDPELIRSLERSRLHALVEADMDTAVQIHADDFQLVNPSGRIYTRDQYLGGIESGDLDYLVFEPESGIQVRIAGQVAVIRYRSTIEIKVGDQYFAPERFWHTDTYEFRDGRWLAVWSQATAIVE